MKQFFANLFNVVNVEAIEKIVTDAKDTIVDYIDNSISRNNDCDAYYVYNVMGDDSNWKFFHEILVSVITDDDFGTYKDMPKIYRYVKAMGVTNISIHREIFLSETIAALYKYAKENNLIVVNLVEEKKPSSFSKFLNRK